MTDREDMTNQKLTDHLDGGSEITRINHPENLELYLEHDSGWIGFYHKGLDLDLERSKTLVFSRSQSDSVFPGAIFIQVDEQYSGMLSPGQLKLYEILLTIQQSSIYSVTTIGALTDSLGLENPLATLKRMENLQILKAISGFK